MQQHPDLTRSPQPDACPVPWCTVTDRSNSDKRPDDMRA